MLWAHTRAADTDRKAKRRKMNRTGPAAVRVCARATGLPGMPETGSIEVKSTASAPDEDMGPLSELIRDLKQRTEQGEQVSIGLIQEIAGRRAAGPMLLLPALIVISPLSIIPGLPTMVGLNTILVAGQVLLGCDRLWLPNWLKHRCISAKYASKLLRFLTPVGRVADKVAKPRAKLLTSAPLRRLGAGVCVLVGCIMPVLEVVPFTSTWAASIIAVYGLAITAKDGFLALGWAAFVCVILSIAWMIFA